MIRLCALISSVVLLGACSLFDRPPIVLSDYAQNCVVIAVSRKDTPETQKQVLAENNKCRAAIAAEAPGDGK